MLVSCGTCGTPITDLRRLAVIRYQIRTFGRPGRPVGTYCDKRCAAAGRRHDPAEKKARKARYDVVYRRRNLKRIKARKAAYYRRTFDPEKMRRERQKRAKYHVEYCRRYYADPKRKAGKVAYDLDRRAAEYGPFGEAYKVWLLLVKEVRRQIPDSYERMRARGYFDRVNERRREQRRTRDAEI